MSEKLNAFVVVSVADNITRMSKRDLELMVELIKDSPNFETLGFLIDSTILDSHIEKNQVETV